MRPTKQHLQPNFLTSSALGLGLGSLILFLTSVHIPSSWSGADDDRVGMEYEDKSNVPSFFSPSSASFSLDLEGASLGETGADSEMITLFINKLPCQDRKRSAEESDRTFNLVSADGHFKFLRGLCGHVSEHIQFFTLSTLEARNKK